jgi:hypothetical protein
MQLWHGRHFFFMILAMILLSGIETTTDSDSPVDTQQTWQWVEVKTQVYTTKHKQSLR